MNRPSAIELRKKLTPLAEEIVSNLLPGTNLDYTPQSVQTIEKALDILHKDYKKSKDDSGIKGIALEFAAYIVEVIDRNYGPVDWQRDDSNFGIDTFPLYWRSAILFPFGWCQKRIFDGPADNVWSKFSVLVIKENENKNSNGDVN